MALPMLAGGADCGPVNPLQGLSKELDRDRGLQQDHFGAARAGSSTQAFRSQYAAAPGADQDAARFFAAGPSAGPSTLGAAPYDLSALHTALPPLAHAQSPVQSPPAAAPWAADFLQQQPPPAQTVPAPAQASRQADAEPHLAQSRPPPVDAGLRGSPFAARTQWVPGAAGFAAPLGPLPYQPVVAAASQQTQQQPAAARVDDRQWELAFESHEAPPAQEEAQEAQRARPADDPDELARAAASLVDAVRHERNPKFQNSAFLGLMRQLRDREVVVEGNAMVAASGASWAADFAAAGDIKGKGKGRAVDAHQPGGTPEQRISGAPAAEEIDEILRQENDAYIAYWHAAAPPQGAGAAREQEGWDRLQRDWDRFEASATGIRPLAGYQFQAHNPYVLGETSRHHMMHAQERNTMYDSVLEMEAAVQRSPADAHAWFQLGVKQQENEREGKAIQALRRALELAPAHLPSWLALAISHTNEGNRQGAFEAIREWVAHNARHAPAVRAYRAAHPERADAGPAERLDDLAACLIAMARADGGGGGAVDADVQIALAVLMNTNEEYEKAKDCFTTALAVRPEDWQLYNRVGATLANSGRPGEALDYYYRALELNPAYIRARFNLGISCINLRRYHEAAQHILDALALQEADAVAQPAAGADDRRGITSAALWDSLKTCCLHLGRLDLATLCDRRELDAFRLNFSLR